MKVNKEQLKELVREEVSRRLDEQFDYSNELVPNDISDYAKRVDSFIEETIEKARDLHDEGEEMMRPQNQDMSYEIQERNRFLLHRVGFLNSLVAYLVHQLEEQLRHG